MKVGDLVRYIGNGHYGHIGVVMESVQNTDGEDVMKMVLWPDGFVTPHYSHYLEVIHEGR